ncbi:MAG: ABC transporter ATP-binding protein [Hyphomicrobiaceae bacterium]|nr:ABC transporter ATP-binding protein [Hyphomicrobiaceae bacterium]
MSDGFLKLSGIEKSFGATKVVHGVDLEFGAGEFVSLLGPSGCGKTTILRMVAGFEKPSAGRIFLGGEDITDLSARQRNVGMVFQSYALFPNMNVAANVGFGLKVAGASSADMAKRVDEMLDIVGLKGFEKRFPFELSGGQQQRVALARALAPRPRMLLLDEPLSALDAKIRVSLRDQIRDIQRELGIATLFVTHDQEEALSISDRIVVINAGRVEQVGVPQDIYDSPQTGFVAKFVGSLNVLKGEVADAGAKSVRLGKDVVSPKTFPAGAKSGDHVSVAFRPEALSLGEGGAGELTLSGTVLSVNFLGAIIRVRFEAGGIETEMDLFNDQSALIPVRGANVTAHIAERSLLALPE